MSAPDKIAKKATVKDLNLELKVLCEKVIKLEEKVVEKDMKLKELKIAVKVNEEKIIKMEKMLFASEAKKRSVDVRIDCKDCGKCFQYKKDLTDHIKKSHGRIYNCSICEKSFLESWKLELHSKTHEEIVPFKCETCKKHFYSKWRLKKHEVSHDKMGKFCHFFNNGKTCPFEEIGCKFNHAFTNKCRYDRKCSIKLCQFQHSACENSKEIVDTLIETSENHEKSNEISKDELFDVEREIHDKYRKYNEMDEYEQFDVKEEICANICWGGDHKCFDHEEDNELLGVDVEKIRDDYNNSRKETFHCEKCKYVSKDMDNVRKHFLAQHEISYSCWECDEKFEMISEFKKHYGSLHYTVDLS